MKKILSLCLLCASLSAASAATGSWSILTNHNITGTTIGLTTTIATNTSGSNIISSPGTITALSLINADAVIAFVCLMDSNSNKCARIVGAHTNVVQYLTNLTYQLTNYYGFITNVTVSNLNWTVWENVAAVWTVSPHIFTTLVPAATAVTVAVPSGGFRFNNGVTVVVTGAPTVTVNATYDVIP